ncbi:MAG: (2Fe-2S)-binding protein [Allorhizobium sp.]
MKNAPISLDVNGHNHVLDVRPDTALIYVLRNDLGLNGPRFGCGLGECGACAVLIDGRSVRSCTVAVKAIGRRPIVTLEGLGSQENPHPVQRAFIEMQAAQCGYCLNGMIIATTALLNRSPHPDETQIRAALKHHLCRCGTHMEILAAVRRAIVLLDGSAALEGAAP